MKNFAKRWVFGAVLAGVAILATNQGSATAGFTITLDAGSPTGVGPFTFSYTASIPVGDQINAGDFFRIYDFAGYIAGSIAAPAGWSTSIALVNPTPPPNVILSHGDDPAIPNLIFTYSGVVPIVGGASVSGFTAQSTFGFLGAIKDFAGRDTKSTGTTAGTFVDSVGDVRVPGVPEPASLISGAIGMIVLSGYALRVRRARNA